MQITFEVPVVIKARPGKAVNDKTVFGYEPIVIDVPELSDVDAPVVLRYTRVNANRYEQMEVFRGHDGALYHVIPLQPAARVGLPFRRQRVDDGVFDRQMAALSNEVDRISEGRGSDAAKHMAPAGFCDAVRRRVMDCPLEPIEGMNLKGDFEASLREQVEAFRRHLHGIVIIDGRFHLPEEEPLLALAPLPAAGVEARVVRAAERGGPDLLADRGLNLKAFGYFRFDEIESLRSEAARLTNGNPVRENFRHVDLIDPSLFQTDTPLLTLIGLGATLRQYFASSIVSHEADEGDRIARFADALYRLPTEQIVLYKNLVSGIEVAKQSGIADRLETALTDILDLPYEQRRQFVYSQTLGFYAHNIVRRWNDREVRLDGTLLDIPMKR
ncbi:hypothetical protein GOB57_24255 [Sinorhizobium meliloti]|nr:hypothetical protein [Sinorhizobium meliloti]